uniref:Uncharacterized protein n=1 Tax=Kalanchoe fedtschenkoi TaxID=63787 RepID=A0A7N0TDK7_KALFE
MQNLTESLKDGTSVGFRDPPTNLITDVRLPHDSYKAFSSCSSALDISSDAVCTVRADTCFSNISEAASRPLSTGEDVLNALPLSAASQCMKEECAGGEYMPENLVDKALEKVNNFQERRETDSYVQPDPIRSTSNCSAVTVASPERDSSFDKQATSQSTGATTCENASDNITLCHSAMKVEIRPIRLDDEKNIQVRATDTLKDEQISGNTGNFTGEQILAVSEAHYTNKNYTGIDDSTNRLQHVKPVESLSNSGTRDVLVRNQFHEEAKEAVYSGTRALSTGNQKAMQFRSRGSGTFTDIRVQKLEQRIKQLEGELREAAAIEAALYSVVAEHGSSMNKFYAPARRLFRFYLHAREEKSRASAAKTSVSGLVLVTKASGNDVPRLSFWLSNCVVLRAMISLATGYSQLPVSTGLHIERDDDKAVDSCRSSSLNWKEMNHINDDDFKNSNDWGDPQTYASALEKVEGWIFSRIVESLWWQSLVPYMQCNEASFRTSLKSGTEHKGATGLNDQGLSNFSVQLWKEAFKDASEKLCPVRAERHDCGCLSVLSQLIMEQCIVRLDVAMFNAIFRNSVDEVPTDPISDPIRDPRVLPVPIGKSSFGAGAQLKNAIGNWSRRLNELFGLRDDKLSEDEREQEDEDEDDRQYASTKYFYLLNILSELMMLPKDLLLNNSVRKEVCPTFGARLIKRLLDTYIPDELCPELVPEAVLEALDCEEANEFGEDCISHVPCAASPPVYLPPSADSIAGIIGETGNPELIKSGFSFLRKSYTSDDELEELHSPLSFIVMDGFGSSGASKQRLKKPKKPDGLRYQLLREVWLSSP